MASLIWLHKKPMTYFFETYGFIKGIINLINFIFKNIKNVDNNYLIKIQLKRTSFLTYSCNLTYPYSTARYGQIIWRSTDM